MDFYNVVFWFKVAQDASAKTAAYIRVHSEPTETVVRKLLLGVVALLKAVEAGQTTSSIKLIDVGPQAPGRRHCLLFHLLDVRVDRGSDGAMGYNPHIGNEALLQALICLFTKADMVSSCFDNCVAQVE